GCGAMHAAQLWRLLALSRRTPMTPSIKCLAAVALISTAAVPAQGQDLTTSFIPGVVAEGTLVEVAKGDLPGHTEGPIGMADGSLHFASPSEGRLYRLAPDGSASVYMENTSGANGLAIDARGRVI